MHFGKSAGLAFTAAATLVLINSVSAGAEGIDLHGSLGEAGYTRYVAPVSSPIFNETPYITTEARPMWLHQNIPGKVGVASGIEGDIDVIAVQLRVAITDKLGFIATKDGWADIDWQNVLTDDDGFANLAFGFKYNVWGEKETNTLATVGIKYEAPSGNLETYLGPNKVRLQGQGSGLVDLFVSGARVFGPVGIEASLGTQIACDQDDDTSFLHWSLHADYGVIDRIFPLVEINGWTPISDGNRTALGVNGLDLVNLGATNSSTVVTFASGLRVKLHEMVDLGVAFELPMTSDEDIMDWRTTTDVVVHL